MRDPYIACPGNHVPNNAQGLPTGFTPREYFNVMQLCSALNGQHKNVGCACTSSQAHSFHCYVEIADSELFQAIITDSGKPFPIFCAESCFCTDSDTAARDRGDNLGDYHYHGADEMDAEYDDYADPSDPNHGINNPDTATAGGDPGNGWDKGEVMNKDHATSGAVSHGQCWTNCTSNADCSTSGEKGCMCATRSEQYQPSSGTVAFAAACIISMSGNGGKREEMRPCPCNATYVSHSCCGVDSGLVWEEERFKLGELVMENEL